MICAIRASVLPINTYLLMSISIPQNSRASNHSVRMAAAAKRRASCSPRFRDTIRAALVDGNGRDHVSVASRDY